MSIYQRDPAAPGANVGRRRIHADSRLEQAVTHLNASSAAQTIAGLTRSLGRPTVSVGAAAGSPSEVRITVAWELCWYQWGVDLDEELGSVREIAKGTELAQLDRSARQWNAGANEGGQLALGGAARPVVRRRGWLRRR